MGSFCVSVVAAALTGLMVTANTNVFAQASTEAIQAGALLESAERLERDSSGDIEAITTAYEQALTAYDQLGNTDKSLHILDTLYAVNFTACRDEEASRWASQALERFTRRDFNLGDRLFDYKRWVNVVANWHRSQGETAQALDVYTAALDHLSTLPPSMEQDFPLELEAEFLRSQLALHPRDSHAATVTGQRLIGIRQRTGAVTEVNGLISDATFLSRQANDRPSLPGIELLQRALDLSRLNNYPAGEVQALALLTQQALVDGNYAQTVSYGNLVLTTFNQLNGAEPWLADARYGLAQAQQELGNDLEAIKHYAVLLIELNSEPEYRIRASKYNIVVNLIHLYERIGYTASANELATDYSDLLIQEPLARAFPNRLSISRPRFLRPLPIARGLCFTNSPAQIPSTLPRISPQPAQNTPVPAIILQSE